MSMYYIKTGLEYWKPKGYGYTKSREEAGVFTLKDMEELNLDGCTLERAEAGRWRVSKGHPLARDMCQKRSFCKHIRRACKSARLLPALTPRLLRVG